MNDATDAAATTASTQAVVLHTPASRVFSAALVTVSRAGLLVLLVLLLFFETRLSNPLRLIRVFTIVCLVPELARLLVSWMSSASLRMEHTGGSEEDRLVLDTRRRVFEIPIASIEDVRPWTVPLPSNGLTLRLRSGRQFAYGLELADPACVVDAIGRTRPSAAPAARETAATTYALARSRAAATWYRVLLDFPVLALVPTLPLFRLHQWITYGGTFGEYYMWGLSAYLLAFGIYWASSTIWLVLYAAALRAIVEIINIICVALVAAPMARRIRKATEVAARVLYYGAVPLFLVRLWFLTRT